LDESTPTLAELYDGQTFAVSNNPHLVAERGYDRGFDYFSKNRDTDTIEDTSPGPVDHLKRVAGRSDLLTWMYRGVKSNRSAVSDKMKEISGPSDDDLTIPINRSAGQILDKLKNAVKSQNGFFWAHLMDVHFPFTPQSVLDKDLSVELTNEEIQEINDRFQDAVGGNTYSDPVLDSVEADLDFLREMYLELARYIDRQLYEVLDWFKSTGMWDDTLIAFMSDHGEAFGEQDVYNHDWTADPIDTLVQVPLLVKYPQGAHAGDVFEHQVQNADLFPTVADELEWDVSKPPGTEPFTTTTGREIISKSNTAIRLTTETGSAIKRRNTSEISGPVDETAKERLRSIEIPNVEQQPSFFHHSRAEREELDKQLERLGYK
jgi:hypothetical protein